MFLNWPTTLLGSLGLMVFLLYWGGYARVFMIAYVTYILFIDSSPSRAGESWSQRMCRRRVRNLPPWKALAGYFPVQLVKTTELPPDRTYLFGYHPHGILSVGAMVNFSTNATGFDDKFPGVDVRPLTLKSNLLTPFHREWAMLHGCGDASRECVNYCLNSGKSVLLVLGGAAESLDARPGHYALTLLHRKGFVKCALKAGADLVPTFAFGENDLFSQMDNPTGSRLRKVQEWVKSKIGFAPPVVNGRGVFNLSYGCLPRRRRITTVIGAPLRVDKVEDPAPKQINELHARYVKALTKLFDTHKAKYGDPKETLQFK